MKLYYHYDKGADVLYFSEGKPSPRSRSVETEDDVVLRIHPKTKKVTGFTILNFTKRAKRPGVPIRLPIRAELLPA
ncbi:MAG: DUF2283 domain-containing protein [bacterium]|nr:DUF2283 domain-containing protein [bacterium]